MMKAAGLIIQQPQPHPQHHVLVEDNISNLTSAYSGEAAASVSSGNKPLKKKRNLPGNPDPDAEVISLSPKSLLATNRFVCDICNKGFQREQNLQLHRRGHNLPWKLKQRSSKEIIRKKVYVCPEPSCVHHDPSRALGDLTGIKKHFCRKHGEKKWKCDKCSKRYAVRSDLKAHSKTCGTREYRCDCGTLFSRRDSYMTHKALCNVLVDESARSAMARNANQFFSSSQAAAAAANSSSSTSHHHMNLHEAQPHLLFDSHGMQAFPLKKEPQWQLGAPGPGPPPPPPPPFHLTSPLIFPTSFNQDFRNHNQDLAAAAANPNPHISATALLQKATQMGATMSTKTGSSAAAAAAMQQALQYFSEGGAHQAHVSAKDEDSTNNNNNDNRSSSFGRLNLSSRETLSSVEFMNKAADIAGTTAPPPPPTLLLHHHMMTPSGFEPPLTSFDEDAFGGNFIINPTKDEISNNNNNNIFARTSTNSHHHQQQQLISRANNNNNNDDDGFKTRDFLGLRPLPHHSDIFNHIAAGLNNCINNNSSSMGQPQNQDQKPWQ